jgi:drug/metabolite transporter (DMT)-like permease
MPRQAARAYGANVAVRADALEIEPSLAATPLRLWAALGVVSLVWGTTFLAVSVMVETIPPFLGGGVRFIVAGGLLLAVRGLMLSRADDSRAGGSIVYIGRRAHVGCAVSGLGLAGSFCLVGVALEHTTSGLAALLYASVPLWIVLFRVVLARQRVPRLTLASVAIGFSGVGVLVAPADAGGSSSVLGVTLVLAGAAIWAGGAFAASRLELPRDPMVSASWQMLWGSVASLVVGVGVGEASGLALSDVTLRSLLGFLYLLVVSSGIAFTAYSWLVQRAPISQTVTWTYVSPLIAVLAGWLVLDESVGLSTLLGAALVLVSVAVTVATEAREATGTPPP